jgi:anthranilate phosphoribosyltransferase
LVTRSLIGVAQPALLEDMAQVLSARGVQYAILVHGDDGLDELSLGALSTLHVVSPEGRTIERVNAADELGVRHEVASIRGGDVTHNAAVVRTFLEGERGPVFDVVCANAALALMVAGRATSLREGFVAAGASVIDGRAAHSLEQLVAISNA